MLRKHKLRKGKPLPMTSHCLPASCSPSAKGCCHARYVRSEFRFRPTQDQDFETR
ncbi:MAG: hypothetical protein ACR5LD_05605 [Symbiopectobacterium sp.]